MFTSKMTDGGKQICPLVEHGRVEGRGQQVCVVESLTMVEQTHASERRTEEAEEAF